MSTVAVAAINRIFFANRAAARELVASIVSEKGPLSSRQVFDESHKSFVAPPYPHDVRPPALRPETERIQTRGDPPHPEHLIKSMGYLKEALKACLAEGDLVRLPLGKVKVVTGEKVREGEDKQRVWLSKARWEQMQESHEVA
jgi:hypothetical protein